MCILSELIFEFSLLAFLLLQLPLGRHYLILQFADVLAQLLDLRFFFDELLSNVIYIVPALILLDNLKHALQRFTELHVVVCNFYLLLVSVDHHVYPRLSYGDTVGQYVCVPFICHDAAIPKSVANFIIVHDARFPVLLAQEGFGADCEFSPFIFVLVIGLGQVHVRFFELIEVFDILIPMAHDLLFQLVICFLLLDYFLHQTIDG